MRHALIGLAVVFSAVVVPRFAAGQERGEDEVFSGPQVGERLAPFKVRGVIGAAAGKEFDVIEQAGGKPVAVIFVHEVTRPSVGLARLIMNYAAKRSRDGLTSGLVFLTDDVTDTENWMKRASRALPQNVPLGVSPDGAEGPGAYGLNRNVAMTVLVGKENRVTANFALVQPSVQADAPKIAEAIVDVLGGGKVPTLAELGARRYSPDQNKKRNAGGLDPGLIPLVRALIQKELTPDEVQEAAAEIESYLAKHEKAKASLGRVTTNIIRAGKLENYGTPAAHVYLRKWSQAYGPQENKKNPPEKKREKKQ